MSSVFELYGKTPEQIKEWIDNGTYSGSSITSEEWAQSVRHKKNMELVLHCALIVTLILIIYAWRKGHIKKLMKFLSRIFLLKKLTSPIKRIGFLFIIFGIGMTIVGIAKIGPDNNLFTIWWETLTFKRTYYTEYKLTCFGGHIAFIGLLLSYLYDYTIGPLFNWIKGKKE